MELPRSKRVFNSKASTNSSIASDRLRKAIERNRRKQAKQKTQDFTVTKDYVVEEVRNAPRASSPRPSFNTQGSEEIVNRIKAESLATSIRRPAPAAERLSYESNELPRKERSPFVKRLQNYALKGAWLFSFVLILRLIFSTGGVLDYRTHKEMLRLKHQEHDQMIAANKKLIKEIKRIKEDAKYQKKLVRDYLGFIAEDEYLILFAKGPSEKSIADSSPP